MLCHLDISQEQLDEALLELEEHLGIPLISNTDEQSVAEYILIKTIRAIEEKAYSMGRGGSGNLTEDEEGLLELCVEQCNELQIPIEGVSKYYHEHKRQWENQTTYEPPDAPW